MDGCERINALLGPARPPVALEGDAGSPSENATLVFRTPTILDGSRFAWYRQEFEREYGPVGPTEVLLVTDLARQAAAAERWGEAAIAIERAGARTLPQLGNSSALDDAVLVAAMSTDTAVQSERHCLARTRAFHRTLEKLEQIQSRRQEKAGSNSAVPELPFADESACENFLAQRMQGGDYRCPRCGTDRGWFLRARRVWECHDCHAQSGLRAGTVMANSALPLLTWFRAIQWMLWRPTTTVAALAATIGIERRATVREVAQRIRLAMRSDDGTRLLAGLDQLYGCDQLPTCIK